MDILYNGFNIDIEASVLMSILLERTRKFIPCYLSTKWNIIVVMRLLPGDHLNYAQSFSSRLTKNPARLC